MAKSYLQSKSKKRFHAENQAQDGYVSKKYTRPITKSGRQEARREIREYVNGKRNIDD